MRGVSEDELRGQHPEKVQYSGTTAIGDYEQALQRTIDKFRSASTDMKQSGRKEIHGRRFAELFSLLGNKAMQSKLYGVAIDYYGAAIVLGGDKAIYYCDRAAAYIQTCQYAEAILDCKKSIAVDPNYNDAYIHLGYIYFVQGMEKAWQQGKESGQNSNWSYSSGVKSVRDQVPPSLFGINFGAAITKPSGELHAIMRAACKAALHHKTTLM